MKRTSILFLTLGVLASVSTSSMAKECILKASKDTFGRSNRRNGNSGANEYLLIAHSPEVRSIVAFDLTGITNEITAVEFQFRQHNSMVKPVSLVIAPMIQTEENASWKEGSGALGVQGENARPGEATFAWRAYRDRPWVSAPKAPVVGFSDSKLWGTPVATLSKIAWKEGTWIKVPVQDVSILEKVRASDSELKMVTFSLWGTAGDGLYMISAKESGNAPTLILTLKDDEKAEKQKPSAK